jgi:hypothetical protein
MNRDPASADAVRVLAFTCSRDRPVLLRHCILQMRSQSYPVDHAVYINGDCDTRALYEDLASPRLVLRFGPTATNHVNHLRALGAVDYERYDLFCKVDDDDVYRLDYIEGVVEDFLAHRWDYSGAHADGLVSGRRWLPSVRSQSLGLSPADRDLGVIEVMPPTTAFSRRGIEQILGLGDTCPEADATWRSDDFEDIGWRRAIARAKLRQAVRGESRFVYHVHDRNVSTAAWMPAENRTDSGRHRTPAPAGAGRHDGSLIDARYVAERLTREARWCEGHGAAGEHLGLGLLYYTLVYAFRARVAVCLGSGGGFVPRLMRQAQRDLGIASESRTILVDANRPEAGWGSPAWLAESSFFRREFDDIELVLRTTREAAERVLAPQGIRIDYLHIDADHTFAACLDDFTTYRRFLGPGSIVTLHDTRLEGAGVRSVVDHLRTRWDCEVVDFPGVGAGTALVRIREGGEAPRPAPFHAGSGLRATARDGAPMLPPPSIGWRYLESESFSIRHVVAAHFLRPCRTIVELGASARGIEAYLTGEHDEVLIIDPQAKSARWDPAPGRPFGVSRIRARFQDIDWDVPAGASFGMVLLGMELQGMSEDDYRRLFDLLNRAQAVVIEFPRSWEPSRLQFEKILASTRTRVRCRALIELAGNDFGDLTNSWPARTDRDLYVLEPRA